MQPCNQCPFSRAIEPGYLGGSPPETFIGQAVLPFWLPCHQCSNYRGKESDASKVRQCAGAAIFRANIGSVPPAPMLVLPKDTELVFSTVAEFYAHHKRISRLLASYIVRTPGIVDDWARMELEKAEVKAQRVERRAA